MTTLIKSQLLTEKTTLLSSKHNQYTFLVSPKSNKISIAREVENVFPNNIKVTKVNILATTAKPKKNRRTGRGELVGGYYKKAVVTLQAGHKIELV